MRFLLFTTFKIVVMIVIDVTFALNRVQFYAFARTLLFLRCVGDCGRFYWQTISRHHFGNVSFVSHCNVLLPSAGHQVRFLMTVWSAVDATGFPVKMKITPQMYKRTKCLLQRSKLESSNFDIYCLTETWEIQHLPKCSAKPWQRLI